MKINEATVYERAAARIEAQAPWDRECLALALDGVLHELSPAAGGWHPYLERLLNRLGFPTVVDAIRWNDSQPGGWDDRCLAAAKRLRESRA